MFVSERLEKRNLSEDDIEIIIEAIRYNYCRLCICFFNPSLLECLSCPVYSVFARLNI